MMFIVLLLVLYFIKLDIHGAADGRGTIKKWTKQTGFRATSDALCPLKMKTVAVV